MYLYYSFFVYLPSNGDRLSGTSDVAVIYYLLLGLHFEPLIVIYTVLFDVYKSAREEKKSKFSLGMFQG